MKNAQYDWFDIVLNNQDKDIQDFAYAGVSDKNTVLKDASYYKDIPEVQEKFTNPETGKFNDLEFEQFYNGTARTFNKYIQSQFNQEAITGNYDVKTLRERNKLTGEIFLQKVANPTRYKVGASGVYRYTEGTRSMREAAQDNYVWDPETKKFEKWKPNDDDKRGLLDFMGLPPLVEARWGEDGVHEEFGRKVKHRKGDWKVDSEGNPYYEKLAGRDASGKNFLHMSDTFTVDGSEWNKWDPFDSDGVTKNVGGTIMKTALTIAPYFIPGVNMYWGYAQAGMLLSSALATFGKAGIELTDSDYESNLAWNVLNNYTGYTSRFDTTMSDNPTYFEQGMSMIGDVVGQLYQQRAIANIPKMLNLDKNNTKVLRNFVNDHADAYVKKFNKPLVQAIKDGDMEAMSALTNAGLLQHVKNVEKLGERASDMSKLYMVLTQTEGVYDTFKENNFDATTTAIGLLGTAYGFHRLFQSSLGDIALQGLGLDDLTPAIKAVTKDMAKSRVGKLTELGGGAITSTSKTLTKNKIKQWGTEFADKVTALVESKEIYGSMLKEGIEEISEEVLQDMVLNSAHYINQALDDLGFRKTNDTYNYFETNPLERYIMSGLGGVAGGGIFPLMTKYENWLSGASKAIEKLPKEDVKNLTRIIRTHGLSKVEQIINKEIEQGKYGSKALSAELVETKDGESYYKPAKTAEESQNYVIGQSILGVARAIDSVINTETKNIDNADIINSALGKDARLAEISKVGVDKEIAEDFLNIMDDMIRAKAKLDGTMDSTQQNPEDVAAYKEAKKRYESLMNGERAAEYAEKIIFKLNRSISAPFDDVDIYLFSLHRGKNYNNLSESEKKEMDALYRLYQTEDKRLDRGYNAFKYYRDMSLPQLELLRQKNITDVKAKIQETVNNIESEIASDYISTEEVDAYKKVLKEQIPDVDAFIRENNLDPDNKLSETQKQELVDNYIDKQTENWANNALLERAGESIQSNLDLGFDESLRVANEERLLKSAQLLSEIAKSTEYIDRQTIGRIDKLLDKFNKFDFNKHSGLVASKLLERLNAGESIKVNAVGVTPLGNYDVYTEWDATEITISKNTDPEINSEYVVSVEDGVQNGALELNYDKLLQLVNEVYQFEVRGDSNKLVNGIYKENGQFNFRDDSKGTVSRAIQDHIAEMYQDNATLPTLFESYQNLAQVRQNSVNNPIWDLLSKMSKELTGEDVFEIIKSENRKLASLGNIADYVIDNKMTEGQIRTALDAIKMLKSVLTSSKQEDYVYDATELFTMVDASNRFRQKNGEELLVPIKEKDLTVIFSDLNSLEDTLGYILQLNELNSGSKTLESSKTLIRNEILLLDLLSNTDTNKKLFGGEVLIDGQPFFDFNLLNDIDALGGIYKEGSSDVESMLYTDALFTKMQKYYYDKFQALTEEQQNELLKILATNKSEDNIGLDYLSNKESKIKYNSTHADLYPMFVGQFAVSMLAVDQKDIKKSFTELLNAEGQGYAPFFGQYLSIIMSTAMTMNPEVVNKYLSYLGNDSGIVALKNQPILKNIVFIKGDPGSGKTTGVAYFIDKLLRKYHPDANILVAAPQSDQADKFSKLLENDKSYNKEELFTQLLNDEGMKFYNTLMETLKSDNPKNPEVLDDAMNLTSKDLSKYFKTLGTPTYVMIDEYTHFSAPEMELLARVPNVRVVALGDIKQEGFKVKGQDFYATGVTFMTPELMMSVRAANGHKKDNSSLLSSILRRSKEKQANSDVSGEVLDLTPQINELRDSVALRYYEDANELQGDKIVESVSESYIRRLANTLKDGEKLCLVSNKINSPLFKMFEILNKELGDKVIYRQADEIQGSEYKYVVLDVEYNKIRASSAKLKNNEFLEVLKAFYTHITRSSSGSIIISKDNNLPVTNSANVNFPNNATLPAADIDNYKQVITQVYENSTKDSVETPTEEPKPVVEKPLVEVDKLDKEVKDKKAEYEVIENSDDFKRSNLGLYYRPTHTGLTRSGNSFTPNNKNEDLSPILDNRAYTKEELLKSDEYKAWSMLQSILSREDKQDSLNNLSSDNYYKTTLQGFSDKLAGGNYVKLLSILSGGSYKLKLSQYDPTTDYQLDQLDYDRKDAVFARLVYQVTDVNGNTYDITLADISAYDNIMNDDFKKLLTTVYDNPTYFDVDPNQVNLRGLLLKEETNTYGKPLSEVMKENPSIKVSKVFYAQEGTDAGKPFVFISDNPFATEEDLVTGYNAETPFIVLRTPVGVIHRSFDKYFEDYKALREAARKAEDDDRAFSRLRKFIPHALPGRFARALYLLEERLKEPGYVETYNKTAQEYNDTVDAYNEEVLKAGGKKIKYKKRLITDADKLARDVHSILNGLEETGTPGAVLKSTTISNTELDKVLSRGVIQVKPADRPLKDVEFPRFSKTEISELKKRGRDISLIHLFEKLSNPEDPIYEKMDLLGEGTETGKDAMVRKAKESVKVLNALNTEFSGIIFNAATKAISSGLLFNFTKNVNVMDYMSQIPNMDVLYVAMDASEMFPDGVWVTGRNVDAPYVDGYLEAQLDLDQVYMNRNVGTRRAYIPYNAINTSRTSESSPARTAVDLTSMLESIVGTMTPDLQGAVSEMLSKFQADVTKDLGAIKEDLKTYINANYQNIKQFAYSGKLKLLSLSWDGETLSAQEIDVDRESLLDNAENQVMIEGILDKITNENLVFNYTNNRVTLSLDDGTHYEVLLTDNGTIKLEETFDQPVTQSETTETISEPTISSRFNEQSLLDLMQKAFKNASTEIASNIIKNLNNTKFAEDSAYLTALKAELSEQLNNGEKLGKKANRAVEKAFEDLQINSTKC